MALSRTEYLSLYVTPRSFITPSLITSRKHHHFEDSHFSIHLSQTHAHPKIASFTMAEPSKHTSGFKRLLGDALLFIEGQDTQEWQIPVARRHALAICYKAEEYAVRIGENALNQKYIKLLPMLEPNHRQRRMTTEEAGELRQVIRDNMHLKDSESIRRTQFTHILEVEGEYTIPEWRNWDWRPFL